MHTPAVPLNWRREARELAVQALTQLEVQGAAALPDVSVFLAEGGLPDAEDGSASGASRRVRDYAAWLALGAWQLRQPIDELLDPRLEHWSPQRVGLVERAVLRAAVFEAWGSRLAAPAGTSPPGGTSPPPAVVLDEAIEIARRYAGDDAARFVNGVLDAVMRACAGTDGAEGAPGEA